MTRPSGTTLTHDEPPRLDPHERERVRTAREELLAAETLDLSTASRPTLVLYHERLRGALADLLRLFEDRGLA